MSLEKQNQHKSEIDLIEVGSVIFDNKWKILLTTIVVVVTMFGYQVKQPVNYTVRTEVRPYLFFDQTEYKNYNQIVNDYYKVENFGATRFIDVVQSDSYLSLRGLNEINRNFLLKLFILKFSDFEFLKDQIIKFNYFEKKNYADEREYENALKQFVYSIKVLDSDKQNSYPKIKIITKDLKKWKDFLKFIETPINEEIRLFLKTTIAQEIEFIKKREKNKLIDISIKIKNEAINYEIEIVNKLAFLSEQAEIARTLNITKNSPNPSITYSTDTGLITNSVTQIPYYMRGFEMIEKEVELIKGRIDQESFSEELNNLRKQKRSLISTQGQVVERLQKEFIDTPIHNLEIFRAAKLVVELTSAESDSPNISRILFITGIFSLIFAVIYVVILNEVRNRK